MLLKIGYRGAEVKELQEMLGIPADGIFGSQTETEVKKFQKENGLSADGIVGPNTLKVLNASTDLQENPEKEEPKENTKPVEVLVPLRSNNSFFQQENTKKVQRIKSICFYIILLVGTIHTM